MVLDPLIPVSVGDFGLDNWAFPLGGPAFQGMDHHSSVVSRKLAYFYCSWPMRTSNLKILQSKLDLFSSIYLTIFLYNYKRKLVASLPLLVFFFFLKVHVSQKYPADLSLSALMSFFGTIQTTILTAIFVEEKSWHLKWEGGLVLLTIFYGVRHLIWVICKWS